MAGSGRRLRSGLAGKVKTGMRRGFVIWVGAVLALAGVGAVGASAETGPVRQGVEGPETIAEAQRMIEGLPYEFTFTHPPRDARDALVIRIIDKHERTFRFFLFRGRAPRDIGVPGYHLDHLEGGQLGESFVMFENGGKQIRPETITLPIRAYQGSSGITKAMEDEYFDIDFDIEDAVCELSTGKPCPAL
jgi:hypothetical protein